MRWWMLWNEWRRKLKIIRVLLIVYGNSPFIALVKNIKMKQSRIVYRCTIACSFLLIIAALYRGLSINNLIVAENTGDIGKHFSNTVLIDGILSATLLFGTAVWLLFLSGDLKKFSRKAWLQAVFIGLT